ncbi:MAG: hypothetical protein AAF799_08695 [Myxococcota bacterium]
MQPKHDHATPSGAPPAAAADAERIAAELAALGEDPIADDELAFASTTATGLDDEDVGTVATLVGLSRWTGPAPSMDALLPLERHRVWRQIASRTPAPVVDPSESPAANGLGGWRGMVAGLGLVAGLALIPRFDVAPPASQERQAATQSAGEAARMAIDILGDKDGARASSVAADYEARLRATRGGE